jgi:hypothetical protein
MNPTYIRISIFLQHYSIKSLNLKYERKKYLFYYCYYYYIFWCLCIIIIINAEYFFNVRTEYRIKSCEGHPCQQSVINSQKPHFVWQSRSKGKPILFGHKHKYSMCGWFSEHFFLLFLRSSRRSVHNIVPR